MSFGIGTLAVTPNPQLASLYAPPVSSSLRAFANLGLTENQRTNLRSLLASTQVAPAPTPVQTNNLLRLDTQTQPSSAISIQAQINTVLTPQQQAAVTPQQQAIINNLQPRINQAPLYAAFPYQQINGVARTQSANAAAGLVTNTLPTTSSSSAEASRLIQNQSTFGSSVAQIQLRNQLAVAQR